MQPELVKLCPQCGGEFQMWVERCLDCGAVLVQGLEGQGAGFGGRREGIEEEPEIPLDSVLLRTAEVDWIRRLSEDLDEAGIRHWVTPPEWRSNPSLYVLPSDEEAAALIDQTRYAIEVPEVGAEEARPRPPVSSRRRNPSAYDLDVKLCPSCGGEYQLRVETCVDCGVSLVRPWDLDAARESPAPRVATPVFGGSDDPNACPACGERLPEGTLDCPECGLTLMQPEACPNCGSELEAYVSSCRRCGYELFSAGEGAE